MPPKTETRYVDRATKAILLIRILVGWVFLSEGIQKFLFPDSLGVGRFVKIGIPWPQAMAPFVGVVEIVCGSLLLIPALAHSMSKPSLHKWACATERQTIVPLASARALSSAPCQRRLSIRESW